MSCGDSSKKGAWSSADMDKCIKETKSEMSADIDLAEVLSVAGVTMDELVTCACETMEDLYESESEASKDLESKSDEEIGNMVLHCFKFDDVPYESSEENDEEWSEEFINEFMESCSGDDSEMTAYCNCMLTQLMLNYTIEDMEVLTEEDMIKMDGTLP